ncbi:uncharacterized protein [Nicotiana sylvestris]|uniref:uncharacterized protein n=1 Tax=Nicotiana sylvestris TaxID=4096 RepID=UPI00388CC2FB
MLIRSSKFKPVKNSTVEGSVNKLSRTNGEPSVVVKKGSPSDVAAKQEKSKVVVPGVANKPSIIVKGARTDHQAYEHRRALMKILNEAHVPNKISENHLEKIANKIFEVNRVTFSDDELPVEGTEHNRSLYLTVKYEDSVVTRMLVDNGSSANISPLSTLNKLKVDDERIHMNIICVRGFDNGGKDSVGDIVLELTIGPVEFTMEFQVLDVVVFYNLLLGQPWIHAAKAVPSTLHQMVKFEWDRQEIVVHGEDNLCAHSVASFPFIEAEDDKGTWVYQVLETVPVEKVPERKCVPTPKIAAASVMVAFEVLRNGFLLAADMKRDKRLKQKAWALPKPIPHLSRSFVKPSARKRPVTIVPSSMVDIDEELIERSREIECDDESEYDEDEAFEEIKPQIREEIIKALFEYKDIVAWSYDDVPGLSTNLVVHKLPIDPTFPPVKQKLRKFKADMSVKIKEEVTEQLDAKVIRVTRYPTWLTNVMPVPKKDGNSRVCVDYRDLNKASPKDNFSLPNIHILIDNCAKHEIGSFVDCYAGYHQILMDEEDVENTVFITPRGTYCYQVMPFGLKNAGTTYMRAMTTIFHDMIQKEIEVYVDDVIIKSRK